MTRPESEIEESFFLAAYLWLERDIAKHDHAFAGAFTVLSGECSHDTFEFEAHDEAPHAALGRLELRKSETLQAGAVVPIREGADFIHRNAHETMPTLTFSP